MTPLVFIGGYVSSPRDYRGLVAALAAPPYNYRVVVAPCNLGHWAITRDRDLRRILGFVRATVAEAFAAGGGRPVTILAHSMGGTLARIYLGDRPYHGEVYGGHRYVDRLVMLGTPHHSQERWTERSVGFVNEAYPGAFYDHVRYTSVVGRALRGDRRGALAERLAAQSYATVSGPSQAGAWGDGVTTLACAVLSGAEYLAVPGLYHTPFHGRPWYGDAAALPLWGRVLAPAAVGALGVGVL
jgi:pimeloyl-ACP methyl ester carboxylesterase